MTPPESVDAIPDDVWEIARALRGAVLWESNSAVEHIARAIMQDRARNVHYPFEWNDFDGSYSPQINTRSPLEITYTNWRGESAVRAIVPIKSWFGSTEWHPEPQWLLRAFDVDKNGLRDFAMKDISSLAAAGPAAPPAASPACGGEVFGPGGDYDVAAHLRLLRDGNGPLSGYTADLLEKLYSALASPEQGEVVRSALIAARTIIQHLINNEHNVETWGLKQRLLAIESAFAQIGGGHDK